MKTVMLWILMICSLVQMKAQSAQVKVYLQQIAANKVLIEYIQKGYRIARTGLTTIGDIKNGEFNLHRDYFSSLKIVNPKIKNMAMVADIIVLQVQIVQSYRTNYKRFKESGQFTDREINYMYSVFTKLLDDTAATLDELFTLIIAGHFQMTDDERLNRLNRLFSNMQSNYVFARHIGNDARVLAIQRMKEKQDVESARALYGIRKH